MVDFTDEELAEIHASVPVDEPRFVRVDILDPKQRSSEPMERYKREAEEAQRARQQARLDLKAREAAIIASRLKAAAEARAAAEPVGFNQLQTTILGACIAELRRQLRKEFGSSVRAKD
jgi:hypothetical protein